jgi:hypothetical protein
MQHQSQDLTKGPIAGKTGIIFTDTVISSAEIERYVAEGKRMQAEAVAAFLTGLVRRVGGVFRRSATTESAVPQVGDEHLSRA